MSRIQVQHCQNSFVSDITNAFNFYSDAKNFKLKNGSGNYVSIGNRKTEKIASFTLIKIFLVWEDFLESVFIRYMCGAQTQSGYSPTLLRAVQPNLSSAIQNILNNNSYLSWNIRNTQNRAAQYFQNGDPFNSVIGSFRLTIKDITTIRNAIAHRSDFARNNFRSLIRRELTYIPRGITPGRFLLTSENNSGDIYLKYYCDQLKAASNLLVP